MILRTPILTTVLTASASLAYAADSPIMLSGPWVPENTHQIDFAALPRVTSEHVVISDVRATGSAMDKLDHKKRRREPAQLPRAV